MDWANDVFPVLLENDVPFYIHEISEYWNDVGSLAELQQEGLVKHIGVSNVTPQMFADQMYRTPAGTLVRAGDVARVVREVRVHLDHERGPGIQHVVKAGHVRGPQALLRRAVEHLDALRLACEPVGELPRPVR